MGDTDRTDLADRLRLVDSLLTAAADILSSLQRVLAEVHHEIGPARQEEEARPRDAEIAELRREVEQLREGMTSRAVIERAKGVLMSEHELSESEAFELLTDLSQRTHRKLRDVAAELVEGGRGTAGTTPRSGAVPPRRPRNGTGGDAAVRTLVTAVDRSDQPGTT